MGLHPCCSIQAKGPIVPGSSPPLEVLFEDNHLLVVNKPAGIPSMGAKEGSTSLVSLAREYLKQKYQKPGNVYVGVVSRLDALVSGVLVLARTSKAAARLAEQFREREPEKVYWAIVEGAPAAPSGELVHWMGKDDARRRMTVRGKQTAGAQEARLGYQTIRKFADATLLEIKLETGRKHQIRLQLAEAGHPILGDRKYGSSRDFPAGIALHAHSLTIEHPTLKQPMTFSACPPKAWRKWTA